MKKSEQVTSLVTHQDQNGSPQQTRLQRFLAHLLQVINHEYRNHKIDPVGSLKGLLQEYESQFAMLRAIMGDPAITFLQGMVVHSVQPLWRFMKNLDLNNEYVVPVLKAFYERFQKDAKGKKRDQWIMILELVSAWLPMLRDEQNPSIRSAEFKVFRDSAENCISLESFHVSVAKLFSQHLVQYLQLPIDSPDPDHILSKLPLFLLPKFIHANQQMVGQMYEGLFRRMLTLDLDPKAPQTFKSFLKNPDDVYQSLAWHNRTTHARLSQLGVNVELAENYQKKLYFECNGGYASYAETLRLLQQTFWRSYQSIKRELADLLTALESLPTAKRSKQELIKLNNLLQKFEKQLFQRHEYQEGSLPHEIAERLYKQEIIAIHENIQKKFHDLELLTQKEPLTQLKLMKRMQSLLQQGKVLHKQYDGLLRVYEESSRESLSSSKYSQTLKFSVEIWDKSSILTYFLGDLVSCCLATDGSYFEAMVQRRMDDGCQIAVVRDLQTGLPVSLVWLFYAENRFNPGRALLTANFVEINSRLAAKEDLCKTVVHHLLYFVGSKFAPHIGVTDFVLRSLDYGLIPNYDGLCSFNKKSLSVKKVGGISGLNEVATLKEAVISRLEDVDFSDFDEDMENISDFLRDLQYAPPLEIKIFHSDILKLKTSFIELKGMLLNYDERDLEMELKIISQYNKFKSQYYALDVTYINSDKQSSSKSFLDLSQPHQNVRRFISEHLSININTLISPFGHFIESHEYHYVEKIRDTFYLEALACTEFFEYQEDTLMSQLTLDAKMSSATHFGI